MNYYPSKFNLSSTAVLGDFLAQLPGVNIKDEEAFIYSMPIVRLTVNNKIDLMSNIKTYPASTIDKVQIINMRMGDPNRVITMNIRTKNQL
jgi:hypothetical protein